MAKKRLPKELFVIWEEDTSADEGGYFLASVSAEDYGDKQIVGIYGLSETRKVRVERRLDPVR